MKNNGRDQLWFNFEKGLEVKHLNRHVTAYFSKVKKRCFCLLLGFFFYLLSENKLAWKDENTHLVRSVTKYRVCF